jgi:TetR/AcrR family transcriptional regulator, lmrAB and yxaGH operons repressor
VARIVKERADVLPALAEAFRQHGYEGATLSIIGAATGLGKGSLYHFFPGGKEEMAAAVLDHVDAWFRANVFTPLREHRDPRAAIALTLRATEDYFQSGGKVCIVGAFALGDARDKFAQRVAGYFSEWIAALESALQRAGAEPAQARDLAEDAVLGVQGAIVLARSLNERAAFSRALARIAARLGVA